MNPIKKDRIVVSYRILDGQQSMIFKMIWKEQLECYEETSYEKNSLYIYIVSINCCYSY